MAQGGGGDSAADAIKSAALDIRRGAEAMRASRALLGERLSAHRCEYLALIDWAERNQKLLPFTYIERFPFVSAGAEHQVCHDENRDRDLAVKATLPNAFGHCAYGPGFRASPVEYLERLAWQNSIFGDEIRLVGVCYQEEQLEIVTSQPWIKTHLERPVPTTEEIDAYLLWCGFRRVPLAPDTPIFYSAELGLIVADAHDQNILRDRNGELAAIDVVVGTPGPALLQEIVRAFDTST